jgi:hypothetical protein
VRKSHAHENQPAREQQIVQIQSLAAKTPRARSEDEMNKICSGRGTGFKRGASDGSAARAFRIRFGPSLSGWQERAASIALPGRSVSTTTA